ncbi:long-chain fatty acid--CoA ligase [Pendulispora brunnea]|uniref:Long-chain-fatty-acid--CoA ligase n=1 Tax=Pendulispora brunnea TaxID=2905690 RepID=A0ABZ2JU67_9BACT
MGDQPWIKSYPKGVSYDRPLARMPVWQILDDTVARWPDQPAIDFMGKKITYRQLADQVERAAVGFRELGVKPGVHVGLYLPNTPHYVVSFFAILKAGGTVVNYSPLDAEKALIHKIEDSETDIMVTLDVESLYPMMAPLLQRTRLRTLVVASSGMPCKVAWADEGHVRFESLLAKDGPRVEPPVIANLDEAVVVLQYTGGTSGQPKGAMLTHTNLVAACDQLWATLCGGSQIREAQERMLVVLPLFHIYALTANMLIGIRIAAEMVFMLRFETEAVLREIAAKQVSIFPGVPTMFSAILNHPEVAKFDLSSLRFCGSGGAPLPIDVQQRFQRLTGCHVGEGWGMTETSPTGTFSPVGIRQPPGSCGLPVPGMRFEFRDVSDPSKPMPLGERGEICVSGPNVTKGYWKGGVVSERTPDGLFRTGDVGYMDENGFVFIVDRTKDMILCGGFNVYPRIIEEAIYEHPAVAEVSVIGIHDEYRGQSPKAFIKLKPGAPAPTLEELKAFLQGRLGKHEMVQALEIRAELPKTLVGKLSKKELYQEEAAKVSKVTKVTGGATR